MNIGYFNANGYNDIEHWFKEEVDELIRRGHNVRVFWLKGTQPSKEDIEWMDFAHYHYSHVALHYSRLKVPFCVSPHTNDIFPDNGNKLSIVAKHPRCKFVTYQSQYHKKHYEEWGIREPYIYLPMCIRTNLFKKEGQVGNKIIAGGRLIPRKGIDRIMYLDNLEVFGDGFLKNQLESMNPKVKFVGHLSGKELKEFYESGYIYLFPARIVEDGNRDGIPNTIKEAMLMGLWIIASPVSGIPELPNIILTDDWSEKNIKSLINKIPHTINTDNIINIKKIYSPEVCIDKLEKAIYETKD
jgi:glycosyltransferase involved in cell wall biosynthesis